MLRIKVATLSSGRSFLSGMVGRSLYPKLVAMIEKQTPPSPIFIDFEGVMVSGSFFSQAILPLRKFARRMDAYLVLCNLDAESKDELTWLLDFTADAVFVCELDAANKIRESHWVGNLEEKQLLTLNAVQEQRVADAASLSEIFTGEDIQMTGWNNRLAALSKKGLLIELRKGRSKSYRPVL